MTNIAESVERDYQRLMHSIDQKLSEKGIKQRVIDTLKLNATTLGLYYLIGISLPKLFPDFDPQFEKYINLDMLEYLKSRASDLSSIVPSALIGSIPLGMLRSEFEKLITWAVYQPMRLGSRGINYLSNKLGGNSSNT